MQTRTEPDPYDWLQIVGVDTPYPPDVQGALDLVKAETTRRANAELQRIRREAREARQARCPHASVERMLLRYANGDPCIDEYRCVHCDKQMPDSKRH